jgi:hypothetical protein
MLTEGWLNGGWDVDLVAYKALQTRARDSVVRWLVPGILTE